MALNKDGLEGGKLVTAKELADVKNAQRKAKAKADAKAEK